MDVQPIEIERGKALELYRAYKTHQHYSQPIDREVQRAYQLIAQGKVIINAGRAIVEAGLNAEGLPKLAIVRADAPVCILRWDRDEAHFHDGRGWRSRKIAVPWPGFKTPPGRWSFEAQTPLVPIHLRPKRGIENYHILFEAEWSRKPPVDPLLLRRIGRSDMWVVVAAWDLTPVELAALSARLHA
ncbi:MAG TPA: hypothetical protein VGR63_19070 [Casimicrobiaceae bacterium]|jgi:hypothetical protein|nr:hypothetical protein [Casimicrobiaceae bacterium]